MKADTGGHLTYVMTGHAVAGRCHKCQSEKAIMIIVSSGRRKIITLECMGCGHVVKLRSRRGQVKVSKENT